LFDYLSLKKVMSVPIENTPFRREDKGVVACMFQYVQPEGNDKGESETLKKVREVVETAKKILNEGQGGEGRVTKTEMLGYTNLGERDPSSLNPCSFPVFLSVRFSVSFLMFNLRFPSLSMKCVRSVTNGSSFVSAAAIEHSAKDKTKDVFGINYPRLQQVKKMYDPEERFSKWFPITPAN
jgi:hypothetical protein